MKRLITGEMAYAARSMNWLTDIEPFSRSANGGSPDDTRLKKALKQAVEKDFVPQSLIDIIKTRIRNAE